MGSLSATVIGAGVVGCAVAYRLAVAGVHVTLVDSLGVGGGASSQSGGHVIVWPDDENQERFQLAVEGYVLFRQLLAEIKEKAETDPMDHSLNLLFVAVDERGRVDLERQAERVEDAGFVAFWLSGSDALRLEPRLSTEAIGGILLPDCIQVGGREFCVLLAEAASREGARIVVDEVVSVDHRRGRVSRIELRHQESLTSDIVVVAAGSWTAGLLSDWTEFSLPASRLALQRLRISPSGRQLGCGVYWNDINITPRRDGKIHAGSVHDPAGLSGKSTAQGVTEITSRIRRVLPGLEYTISSRDFGVATSTPSSMPLLGEVPGFSGLYVAVPADDGFCVSAVMAQTLTRLATGGEPHLILNGDLRSGARSD